MPSTKPSPLAEAVKTAPYASLTEAEVGALVIALDADPEAVATCLACEALIHETCGNAAKGARLRTIAARVRRTVAVAA